MNKQFQLNILKKSQLLIVTIFHNQHKSNVLIVNNENIDLLEDSSALKMMVDRIMGITSIREYFNPQFI